MAGDIRGITQIPELRRRILMTFFFLAVYRLGVHVPVPGMRAGLFGSWVDQGGDSILGLVNMFSGGALSQMSIFALGIMPYISASIILQLLTVVVPTLERLSKEGEQGRRVITQYTRYGTVILAAIQGFGIAIGIENLTVNVTDPNLIAQYGLGGPGPASVVIQAGMGFRLLTVISLTAGTAFIMWLGEQITERGIGNGISLIIFAGIVGGIPRAVVSEFARGIGVGGALLLFIFVIVVTLFVVYVERSQRRIPVHYAKRVVGRKVYGGQSTHLPLKINTAGVIPAIFASSLLMFPLTIGQFVTHPVVEKMRAWLSPTTITYNMLFAGLVIFFSYFYTAIQFNPNDVAENLKKHGGYIPGIRPGQRTAEFIDNVLSRLTFWGGLYVSLICVLPSLMMQEGVSFYFGGTSLLIVVGVALDTVAQIETHLIARNYEGLMGSRRMRGRRS
ncbi:preprotein translocase subunit SecY [bacterium]|nr:MAG: preprotein translocase subunit SecY [bacterium]